MNAMKRSFFMMMLFGALFGLFGQGAALVLAAPAQATEQATAVSGMSADCAEKMSLEPQQPDQPCTGLTLDCIAKMGCAVPLALVPPASADLPGEYREGIPMPMPVTSLVGHDLGPEPEPPARLG